MRSGDSILEQLMFSSKEHGRIVFNETTELSKAEGTVSVEAAGEFGRLQFHEVRNEDFSYRFGVFSILEDTTLTSMLDIPYLGFFINIEDTLVHAYGPGAAGSLYKNQCSMVSLPYIHTKDQLRKGCTYAVFDIAFTPEYLRPWEKTFPCFRRVLAKTAKGIPVFDKFDVPTGSPILTRLLRDIEGIVHKKDVTRLYEENKMHEVLFLLFGVYETAVSRIKLHPDEIKRLEALRAYLEENLEAEVTLKTLAQEGGMNEFKLKAGFKILFGLPVFRFLYEARMKKASALLAERNKSVAEIAGLVGYKNVSSFSAAFKKKFGYSPTAVW